MQLQVLFYTKWFPIRRIYIDCIISVLFLFSLSSMLFFVRYPHCQLIEVNAHSLFSKWFSESGKLV